MKKILLIAAILCSFFATAQFAPGYTGVNSRYDWLGGRFRDGLHVPAQSGFPVSKPGIWVGSGEMRLDSASGKLYFKTAGVWKALADSATAGTVTSIATGYGVTGGTITSTGTISADTTVGVGLISWPRWGKLRDSLAVVIGSGGGGGSVDLSSLNTKLDTANTYRWEHLSDSVSIHARDGAEINYIPFKDSILLTGGWHRDSIPASTKQVYMLSKDMQHFRRLADAPWTNGLHCYGSHYNGGDTLFVWGGDAESPNVQEFWSFKISTETWTLIN